ncbi:hypothetical protein L603_003100000290 [Cellulosimicrobium cellulans J34]|nr:hypothetical protein L603_003100000290 [Cellulosimicrobium cellulans J34]SMF38151.1 hypothetical protein SAMN02744115_02974 [Cellulosimicrobium cellulans J1]
MTAPTATTQSPTPGTRDTVLRAGLRVLADTGRLLARHWPALVAVAVVADVLHELALRAALAVAPSSGVLGLLVLCFSPLATVVGIVVMLHVLRREPRSGRDRLEARTLLGSIASVLVPYLVIYEFYGGLTSDWQTYVDSAALDHAFAAGSGIRTASPIPEGFGVTVLAVVAGALLARTLLDRLARRLDRRVASSGSDARHSARSAAVRIVAGYCEVVWIVVGAFTVTAVVGRVREWWGTRVVVVEVGAWWDGVVARVDALRPLVDALGPATSLLVAGVVTGLVVPLAWLTLGTIVYGVEAIDVVDPAHATVPGTTPADRATRVVDRFNRTLGDRGARRAWELMLDPGRRFGGLVGALGMLWRSRWGAVLLFCVAFALLTLGEQVVLTVAQAVVGQPGIVAWRALVDPLGIVSTVVVQVLTTALLAAAADALLANLGLPSALRTRRSARARAAASVV